MKTKIILGFMLLLGLQLASAYYMSPSRPYPVLAYGNLGNVATSNDLGTRVYQQHVYDVQTIPRHFTHYRQNVLQTVRHHMYQYQDYHNVVDLYSNQYLDVNHPVQFGGSYWNIPPRQSYY